MMSHQRIVWWVNPHSIHPLTNSLIPYYMCHFFKSESQVSRELLVFVILVCYWNILWQNFNQYYSKIWTSNSFICIKLVGLNFICIELVELLSLLKVNITCVLVSIFQLYMCGRAATYSCERECKINFDVLLKCLKSPLHYYEGRDRSLTRNFCC